MFNKIQQYLSFSVTIALCKMYLLTMYILLINVNTLFIIYKNHIVFEFYFQRLYLKFENWFTILPHAIKISFVLFQLCSRASEKPLYVFVDVITLTNH